MVRLRKVQADFEESEQVLAKFKAKMKGGPNV